VHPVGSYCTDITRCTVNITLNILLRCSIYLLFLLRVPHITSFTDFLMKQYTLSFPARLHNNHYLHGCQFSLKLKDTRMKELSYNIRFIQLKQCGSNMFRPILMDHPQGGNINIYINRRLKIYKLRLIK
jgi:hypothetical protein